MGEHHIALSWSLGDAPFTYETYPRNHQISFKNGAETLIVSGAPEYHGDGGKPDPEELLVAALSSCHMLSFLAVAAKKKHTVTAYEDDAVGFLEKEGGKLWVTRVILRPKVVIDVDAATLAELHHRAHAECFIANSVKTDVRVEPR